MYDHSVTVLAKHDYLNVFLCGEQFKLNVGLAVYETNLLAWIIDNAWV